MLCRAKIAAYCETHMEQAIHCEEEMQSVLFFMQVVCVHVVNTVI
jgi:hypothetical protein